MRVFRFSSVLLIGCLLLASVGLFAQNTISGELTGTVSDPTGAVLSGVSVTLKSLDTAQELTTTTTPAGFFRFALLRPGKYTVSAAPKGFSAVRTEATVSLGQVTSIKLTAAVSGHAEVIEVAADAALLQTENGNVTANFSENEISALPAPGNDMTNYALTAPGVTLSTGAGYGNFTAFGLPGTSNLFTVNGSDNNDPFNGLSNTGASNNALGVNELQEVTIVTNGYSGQYGRSAGANVNYSTKSGTNKFHGNAEWEWNGSSLNANDWFNNNQGTARPFSNDNAWAASIGGPVLKDKLFFFFDTEGLRYVLPAGGLHYIPSTLFANDTLAYISANQPSALPFYQNFFNLYAGAKGASNATVIDPNTDSAYGCGELGSTGHAAYDQASNGQTWGTAGAPCAYQFAGGGSNKNTERLMALKIDVLPTQSDKLSFRWWEDRGVQATYTDAINPIFNATSKQPQDQGQMTWTKTLNTHMVNQFLAAGSYYSAIFSATDLAGARAAFPTTFITTDSKFDYLGGEDYSWPQGRRVAQYQFSDDFSWTKGNHDLKFGVNIRHNAISDLTPYRNVTGELELSTWSLFAGVVDPYTALGYATDQNPDQSNGSGDLLAQRYTNKTEAGLALYSLGIYAQDEWRVNSKLKLTLSLRADRNSNESCPKGCFARSNGDFSTIANADGTVPYNASIQTGLKNAFPSLEPFVYSPRVGFAYSLDDKTVIRGGIGLFTDLYPGSLAEPWASSIPGTTTFNVGPGGGGPAGTTTDYTSSTGLNHAGQVSYTALGNGFASGQTYTQIAAITQAAGVTFSRPALTTPPNKFYNPKYWEWNLEVERQLNSKTVVKVNYVGNHGFDEIMRNPLVNVYNTSTSHALPYLTSSRPDSRFGAVIQYNNQGFSNYNGLAVSLARRMSHGFSGALNYTYSHSLDIVSNGGLYSYNLAEGGSSIITQLNPLNPKVGNYANSDYDFRHNLSANYIWQDTFKSSNKALNLLAGGWGISGTIFARSGEPFSVYHSAQSYMGNGASASILAQYLGGSEGPCNRGNDVCLHMSQFALPTSPAGTTVATQATTNWGGGRNMFRGPKYFDTDMTVTKKLLIGERTGFTLGLNFFNLLNHPNFANPSGNLASGFGVITSTATAPSSPYGNFQGAAVSGRVIQTMVKFEF